MEQTGPQGLFSPLVVLDLLVPPGPSKKTQSSDADFFKATIEL